MHITTKFDGGKVMNRCQSGAWEHQCMGAGLRQNIGREWGPHTWKYMTISSPNKVYSNTAERSAKILAADKKRKATEAVKERRRKSKYATKCDTPAARSAYSRHDRGILPDQVTEDLSPKHLQELNSSFYATRVFVTQEERKQIEEQTRDQDNSDQWQQERRKRLTASVVGGIAKMKEK